MRNHHICVAGLLVLGLYAGNASANAQQAGQPAPASSTPSASDLPSAPAPTSPPKDKSKPAAKDASQGSADQSGAEAPPSPTSAPPASAPSKKTSTADDNPFPEDISQKAAAEAKANAASAPAPSATRQSQGSSSLDNIDKLDLDDPARRQLKLESPDGSPNAYDPKRATEDVRVGRFYLQTGYFKGAYDRFKDATAFDHENVEAIFWLAEAARKVNLDKEAEQNYQLYLAVVPDGPNAKIARKALGELSSVGKP